MQLRSKLIALAVATFGVASVFATPITFTLKQQWSAPFPTSGAAGGTPAISSDGTTLYCTSMNGFLYAINTANGTCRWYKDLSNYGGHLYTLGNAEGCFSPTVGADGSIYVCALDWTDRNGKLFALTSNGNYKWTPPFVMDIAGSFDESSLGTPAIGTDGTVYVSADEYDAVLYAVNPSDGTTQWMVPNYLNDQDNAESSPVIGNDCSIYFIDEHNELVAVAKDGANNVGVRRWVKSLSVGHGRGLDCLNNRLALGADGTIYASGFDGCLLAINPSTGEKIWESFDFNWQFISAPIIGNDGMIYVCSEGMVPQGGQYSEGGQLWGFDADNGSSVHIFDTSTQNPPSSGNYLYDRGTINASPAITQDGTIFMTTAGHYGSHLYAINSQHEVSSYNVGANIHSAPVIGPDGTVYFGTDDGKIYALSGNTSPLANSPWPMYSKNLSHTACNAVSDSDCNGGCPSVSIGQQPPEVVSKFVGNTLELKATVTGGLALYYQWKKNGVNLVDDGRISGAQTDTLTIYPLDHNDTGSYTLEVGNPCNTATSNPSAVTVLCEALQITLPPQSIVGAGLGQYVYFEVQATGSDLTYQWQKDGVMLADGPTPQGSSISGSKDRVLNISGVTMADCGTYTVTVVDDCGGYASASATLTTCMQITQQPVAAPGQTTNSATLKVTVTGSGLTYQWKKNGVALSDGTLSNGEIISGARTATLNLQNVPVGDYGTYLVTITSSGCGTVDSTSAVLDFSGNGKWVNTSSAVIARTSPTVTTLNDGKVLVTGSGDIHSQIYDPATETWSSQTMKKIRSYATATLLPSGKVLIAGGTYSGSALVTAELYDPVTGTWTQTGDMKVPRQYHTATLLSSGKVLVAGGYNTGYLNSAELYDPSTGQWTLLANSMRDLRQNHTATALPNGKVLVTGGYNGAYLSSAELYDPTAGTWTVARSMSSARRYHAAVLVNGKVFIAGGHNGAYLSSAEMYNPSTDTWTLTRPMITARAYHTATLLQDGQILLAGGMTTSGVTLGSSEIYNPAADNWTAAGAMVKARYFHGATLLQNGKVLAVGGAGGIAQAELFSNLPSDSWLRVTPGLSQGRNYHTATLMPDNKVLIIGGSDASSPSLSSVVTYDSSSGWRTMQSMITPRAVHTATLRPGGSVLVTGGYGPNSQYNDSVEEFYPNSGADGTWYPMRQMNAPRTYHTATLLPNGQILVVGGLNNNGALSTSELYDPLANTWTTLPVSMSTARYAHRAVLLPSATAPKVLVIGGYNVLSAELYDVNTRTWTLAGNMSTARANATATLLPSGQVLVAGGYSSGAGVFSAELYDSVLGWRVTGSMNEARHSHAATLLPNGKVLITGAGTNQKSCEIFNPATWTWTKTGQLNDSHIYHTATLLPNGDVLVSGGGSLNSVEVNSSFR